MNEEATFVMKFLYFHNCHPNHRPSYSEIKVTSLAKPLTPLTLLPGELWKHTHLSHKYGIPVNLPGFYKPGHFSHLKNELACSTTGRPLIYPSPILNERRGVYRRESRSRDFSNFIVILETFLKFCVP